MKTSTSPKAPAKSPVSTKDGKKALLLSVSAIKKIATREQTASDGGGTGRSDGNDK